MIFQPVFIILISVLKLGISHITDKSSNTVFLYIFLILLPVLQRQQFHLLIQSGIFPFYFFYIYSINFLYIFSPETDADILIVCILQIDSNTESQISFLFFGNPLCLFHVRTSLSGDRTFQDLPICTLYKYLIRLQLVYNPASDCQDTLLCNLFLINMIFNKTFLTKVLHFYSCGFPDDFFFISCSQRKLQFLMFFCKFYNFRYLYCESDISHFFYIFCFF